MLTQELIEYIRQAQEAGMTQDQIRKALAENGWAGSDIAQALASMNAAFDTGRADRIAASITPATPPSVSQDASPVAHVTPLEPVRVSADTPPASPQKISVRKHRVGLMVAILIVVLLLGGGAYAYATYASLPRVVTAAAAERASKTTTYEIEDVLKIELRETGVTTSPQPLSASITLTARSQYDHRASTTPRMHADITLAGDFAGMSMRGTAELARIGREFFVRIREIPGVIALDMGPTYTYIHDRWFSINADTLPNDMRRFGASQDDIDAMETSLEQAFATKDRLLESSLLLSQYTDTLAQDGEEVVENEPARKYVINGTKEFWVESFKKVLGVTSEEERASFNEFITEIESSVSDTSITGTVWVGKRSHEIRKIHLAGSGTIIEPPSEFSGRSVPQSALFTFDYTQIFRTFDTPHELVRPDPSTSIIEAAQYVMTQMVTAQTSSPTQPQ